MNEIEKTILFLLELADKLDGWAESSLHGGWSTHQVEANRQVANECRRRAAELKRVYA